jgi:hypothetical protein
MEGVTSFVVIEADGGGVVELTPWLYDPDWLSPCPSLTVT